MNESNKNIQTKAGRKPDQPLRKGWTTGSCAAAASKAAYIGLLTGIVPDEVEIRLPRGELPRFKTLNPVKSSDSITVSIQKDAGDDPDITHEAIISATITKAENNGLRFHAGKGVGTVTLPGLPLPVGEPAINPKPREIIESNLQEVADQHDESLRLNVTISIENGEELAQKTWNPRLGIVGGLSVLGTTGIVTPFSCSAWIHSIHRGVDVARANGFNHVAGTTGNMSENALRENIDLPDEAYLDMGDFAGGMLKYIRRHPVERVTISGGFAKMLKLAQGNMDLHSSRSQVNFEKLADMVSKLGGDQAQIDLTRSANTAKQVLDACPDLPLAKTVAKQARETALATLSGQTKVDIVVVDRVGTILAHEGAETSILE
ncbi:cobalt-precorrin-5B (C(1))-methyltransferase [Curvivirga aplysinae]|uniref:cobalt-precorrin-5B (C(1))-methyltransferase n=1 Tax=Curvivirga aplysinae TaxID=2529852 RepID=UPI0012BC1238|nr:cobalt-precorrin-5B (C(1))-methyltransferase [Curvivirga aplysinae]MTI10904.1 cobalt-precorrin-5B (C(1))-methyltransferase [Curvivirga aplysinae]